MTHDFKDETWSRFSVASRYYKNRVPLSDNVISCLVRYTELHAENAVVADIGAGTGLLASTLANRGFRGYAVEPNASMRAEGERIHGRDFSFQWVNGTAECTGLKHEAVDWICMANAFHWVDASEAVGEFQRVLSPGGYASVIWVLPDFTNDPLRTCIEAKIEEMEPGLDRAYRRALEVMENVEASLQSSGSLHDCIYIASDHTVHMEKLRYINVFRSVQDIPNQIGPSRWARVLAAIEDVISLADEIAPLYRTYSWTVRK
ncbi:class I SAM-dependent methyltransferase [Rhizobium jaguaris]|uniref:class I SAM-dependent methyltransferase n=1 Tax=Rhizobium jaguaris TaxID=1312183 RepID=UPI0013C474A6|nr:class I SAM-dependent methyltransferase [Rhizobium jaguaris]